MHRHPLLLLPLLLLAANASAEPSCDGMSLTRARFALEIRDREPVGAEPASIPAGAETLTFHTEARGGAGRTLVYRWFRDDQPVAEVSLPVGADRWRSWSSKQLGGMTDAAWRVQVTDGDGCLLAERSLGPASPSPRGPEHELLRQARTLLEQGDITGARLLVADAVGENPSLRAFADAFVEGELAVARVAEQVGEDDLYLASSRLQELEENPNLDPGLRTRLPGLRAELERRRKTLDDGMSRSLRAWLEVQHQTLHGGACPRTEAQLVEALRTLEDSEYLMVGAPMATPEGLEAGLLDSRTGKLHRLLIDCPAGVSPSRR